MSHMDDDGALRKAERDMRAAQERAAQTKRLVRASCLATPRHHQATPSPAASTFERCLCCFKVVRDLHGLVLELPVRAQRVEGGVLEPRHAHAMPVLRGLVRHRESRRADGMRRPRRRGARGSAQLGTAAASRAL